MHELLLVVEERVEDADLCDPIDGELVACGGLADRLRARRVVDAERLRSVVADIRVNPGDALVGVAADDRQACLGAVRGGGDRQPAWKRSLHYVARHSGLLSIVAWSTRRYDPQAASAAAALR